MKQAIADREKAGKKVMAVVEGYICPSTGSASYNLALSKKCAKVLKDRLLGTGMPSDQIKVVGCS